MPFPINKLEIIDVKANDIMGCSESTRVCLKFTIVFLNIPIIVIGAVSLGIGVWVIVDDTSFFDLAASILDLEVLGQDVLRQGAVVMVTAGAAMIVLAGLGVVGALAMSSCLLVTYVVTLMLLLTLEVAVIILGVVFKSEWESKANSVLTNRLNSHYGNPSDLPFTRTFDALQKKLGCCGWNDGKDFKNVSRQTWNTTLPNGQQRMVPDCCCMAGNSTTVSDCVVSPYNSSLYITKGCRAAVEDEFKTYQWVVIGVTIAVLSFQFIVIVLTLVLVVHNVKNKYDMS
ncbi:tetraspanin-1-like [Physella acuta]|uniref:tetraspanin-1-like n=1 Tax=Physella acuta TaxID=109671 RepID=UPI0027DB7331|nr:tetraspanin-1-like [Physella acuta]